VSTLNVETVRLGLKNLRLHKLRALLTALGIIFGVAAVICMLSVTEGASADELRMIQLLGTQNVIINSVRPEASSQVAQGTTSLLQYGITRDDVDLIAATIPHIRRVVRLRTVAYSSRYRDKRFEGQVLGTDPAFFHTVNIAVAQGRPLTDEDARDRKRVCVIGEEVGDALFTYEDPIGRTIYVERDEVTVAYEVVGVLKRALTGGAPAKGVEERNLNREIYIPLSTAESRYGAVLLRRTSGSRELLKFDYSGLYVSVDDVDHVAAVAEMIKRVLEHNHDQLDYEVRVPLARLQLAQRKKRNSQIQLGLIAGISLLVGGIGIMNIMLATVTERTREIGIRRALGAKQRHITVQFLVETVILSTGGGMVGVVLGYLGSWAMTAWAQWGEAIVRPSAVVISFGLSVLVGVFFGMYPAIRAARLDPIEALRHE
jgi:putative ABC transport system permease protein